MLSAPAKTAKSTGAETPPGRAGLAQLLARGLEHAVGAVTGLLLTVGLGVVFTAVIFRYFLDQPIQWSYEAATAGLVAVTFLGGSLALARGEHMGITVLVRRLPVRARQFADAAAGLIVLVVSVALTLSARQVLASVGGQSTPSGHLPAAIFYLPIVVGGLAMICFSAAKVLLFPMRAVLVSAGGLVLAVLVWIVWTSLAPATQPAPVALLVIGVGVSLLIGVPVAYSLVTGALLYFANDGTVPLSLLAQQMESGVENFVLLAIPFFILAGLVMELNGMSRRLIALLDVLLGRVRGGLSLVTIVGMALFSGMSGSKTADVAAVGSVMVPAHRKAGNDDAEAVSLLAATAIMGETIPPCVNMIILGFVANLSIGGLFLAGILPAVFMGIALAVLAVVAARPVHAKAYQSVGHAPPEARDEESLVLAEVAVARPRTTGEWLRLLGGSGAALAMIALILGGILMGFATPTEISAFAVVYALLIGGLVFRELTTASVISFFVRSAALSGMVLFIVAAAQIVGYVLTIEQVPQNLALAMTDLAQGTGTWAFIVVSILMLIVFGSVLEGAPALVIFGPLLIPVARELGINDLQFGIVLIIAMGIGLFSPPIGVGLYTACAVGGVPMERVARPMVKYILVLFLTLLAVAFIPAFTTTLS
jgi:tripartite ATP-independent transporter DctM subunit